MLGKAGLSGQMSADHPHGSSRFLLALSLPLPPLFFQGSIFIMSHPQLKPEGSLIPLSMFAVSSPVEGEIPGPKVRQKEKRLGHVVLVTMPTLQRPRRHLGRWNFQIKHRGRSSTFFLCRNS